MEDQEAMDLQIQIIKLLSVNLKFLKLIFQQMKLVMKVLVVLVESKVN